MSSTASIASMTPASAGTLQLIVGPMFSGKSTELLRQIHRNRSIGRTVLVVNHAQNQRYNSTGLTTHDAEFVPAEEDCVRTEQLHDLLDVTSPLHAAFQRADMVVIEELQFFADAYETVTHIVRHTTKCIVAAGLIADYRREPFGDVLRLMPYADQITHLRGLCCLCRDGTPGPFTRRRTRHAAEPTMLVAAADVYEVVCRRHYDDGDGDGAHQVGNEDDVGEMAVTSRRLRAESVEEGCRLH